VTFRILTPCFLQAPFSRTVSDAIAACCERISAIELDRGEISKKQRAKLSKEAQPYQDFIDNALFAMAGFSPLKLLFGKLFALTWRLLYPTSVR
jgi:hypothetical protein